MKTPERDEGDEGMRQDKDEDEGEDEGEDEDDDDGEIDSDCYILDLSTIVIGVKLWVRNEYIQIYDFCNKYLESARDKGPLSVAITGQPGIERTYWIYYALHRRLCEGKPVIWYLGSRRYLFVSEGVYELLSVYPSTVFKTHVWMLVNADEDKSGIPPHLAVQLAKHFIVFTTSLQQSRRKTFMFELTILFCVLVPSFMGLHTMFNRFGPARIYFKFLEASSPSSFHERRLGTALGKLSSRNLRDSVVGTRDLSMDIGSHTILLMRRQNVNSDGDWGHSSVGPITHAVRIAPRNQLHKERELNNSNSGSGRGKKLPQWPSNHGDSADPSSARQINITPTEVKPYSTTLAQTEDGVYYLPEAEDQVAFDSFIESGTKLYIFQVAMASNHRIKKGMALFFVQESLPPKADWDFVFIVPAGSRLISCSQPQGRGLKAVLDNMNIFSAVLDIEAE
ncbi:hypothetical protein H4582DRAFT_2124471 [Lactarius indigo]|nr:hypothetical protein H4582DRAFT_2124471 [Lactarius indigo]